MIVSKQDYKDPYVAQIILSNIKLFANFEESNVKIFFYKINS